MAQAGLKHEMCLLFHPQCWNCRSMPPHSAAPRSRMLWLSALSYSAPWRESDRGDCKLRYRLAPVSVPFKITVLFCLKCGHTQLTVRVEGFASPCFFISMK